ncbi:hypothetical protein ACOME3_005239 [Neoechinorhynchus agilis]
MFSKNRNHCQSINLPFPNDSVVILSQVNGRQWSNGSSDNILTSNKWSKFWFSIKGVTQTPVRFSLDSYLCVHSCKTIRTITSLQSLARFQMAQQRFQLAKVTLLIV